MNAIQGIKQSILSYLNKLIEPSVNLAAETDRLRARILSAMILTLITFFSAGIFISLLLKKSPVDRRVLATLIISVLLYLVTYFISRTNRYKLAGQLFTYMMVFSIFSTVFTEYRQDRMVGVVCFQVIPSLISCLVLPIAHTLILILLTSIGFAGLHLFGPNFEGSVIFFMWLFYIHVSFLGLVSTVLLSKAEKLVSLQQSNLLQKQNILALGEVAGGVAHEINNPLAIILTSAELMNQYIAKGTLTNESALKFTNKILTSVGRIRTIVSNLIWFSTKPDINLTMETVPVRTIIETTLSLCSESIMVKGIELEVMHEEENLVINCRPVEISQALLHLINNAIDGVEGKDQPRIWITTSKSKGGIVISVLDNGQGVDPAIGHKLFQPFFSSKPFGRHTGLGLNIAYGIAKSHGGSCEYGQDKYGRTRFCLEIQCGQQMRT